MSEPGRFNSSNAIAAHAGTEPAATPRLHPRVLQAAQARTDIQPELQLEMGAPDRRELDVPAQGERILLGGKS